MVYDIIDLRKLNVIISSEDIQKLESAISYQFQLSIKKFLFEPEAIL